MAYVQEPKLAPNTNAGLWVPRYQLDGTLSFWIRKNIGIRVGGYPDPAWTVFRASRSHAKHSNDTATAGHARTPGAGGVEYSCYGSLLTSAG